MKALNIDRSNTYTERATATQLPTNQPYICEIQHAEEVDYTTAKGYRVHRLDIYVDITEGEYKDFYVNRFEADKDYGIEEPKWKGIVKINLPQENNTQEDDWTIKSFNSNIDAIEKSNPGYIFDWDETKLDKKVVGLVLRQKEYCFNGRVGFYSEPYRLISVNDIKAGKFKEPQPKMLKDGAISTSSDALNQFVAVKPEEAGEVPW